MKLVSRRVELTRCYRTMECNLSLVRPCQMPLVRVALGVADPFLWLAKLLLLHVSERVSVACSRWHRWIAIFVSRRLLSVVVLVNPRMSCRQQQKFMFFMARTMEHVLAKRRLDVGNLRSMVAIGCSNRETNLLLSYLVEVVADLVDDPFAADEQECLHTYRQCGSLEIGNSGSSEEESHMAGRCRMCIEERERAEPRLLEGAAVANSHVSRSRENCEHICELEQEEQAVLDVLLHRHHLHLAYVSVMPPPVQRAVVEALWGGPDVRPLLHCYRQHRLLFPNLEQSTAVSIGVERVHPAPLCCITLEAMVLEDETVPADVIAVIQRNAHTGRLHAFLFKGWALQAWMGNSQIPTSPLTRGFVLPTGMFRLSQAEAEFCK